MQKKAGLPEEKVAGLFLCNLLKFEEAMEVICTGSVITEWGAVLESAEEVLAKRYAAGEITKDAFEEAMEVLKKHRL